MNKKELKQLIQELLVEESSAIFNADGAKYTRNLKEYYDTRLKEARAEIFSEIENMVEDDLVGQTVSGRGDDLAPDKVIATGISRLVRNEYTGEIVLNCSYDHPRESGGTYERSVPFVGLA
jgi:hypothetical protein